MDRRIVLAFLSLLAGLALCPSQSTAQQMRLRYAHVGSEGFRTDDVHERVVALGHASGLWRLRFLRCFDHDGRL